MSNATLEQIHNFIPISDHLATAGQPTESQFADIRSAGYQLVVNLAMPNSTNAIAHEQALVEAQGMQYVHIPVVWEEPTLEDIDRFFNTLEANADKPVFVHCALNMRVSAFTYLYRRIRQGVRDEEAIATMNRTWTPNETWQAFIDRVLAHYQGQQIRSDGG
jgi:uncharacterized protein (TIGR01244 family)